MLRRFQRNRQARHPAVGVAAMRVGQEGGEGRGGHSVAKPRRGNSPG